MEVLEKSTAKLLDALTKVIEAGTEKMPNVVETALTQLSTFYGYQALRSFIVAFVVFSIFCALIYFFKKVLKTKEEGSEFSESQITFLVCLGISAGFFAILFLINLNGAFGYLAKAAAPLGAILNGTL